MSTSGDSRLPRALLVLCLHCTAFALLAQSRPAEGRLGQAANELDLQAYQAELDRCASAIQTIPRQPASASELRNSLPEYWPVHSGEVRFRVSTAWLASALEQIESNPQAAERISRDVEARLRSLKEASEELEQSQGSAPAVEARAKLDKIFSQREFHGMSGPSQTQLAALRLAQWLAEQIGRLLSRIHVGVKPGNVLAWSVIVLALMLLSYWIFRSLRQRSRAAELPTPAPSVPSDSNAWVRDALAAAARDDYREAIHCAYWAAVSRLEDLGLLAHDRSRTPRESLRLLDFRPRERSLLADLTRSLELAWYGYRPVSATEWSDARARLEQMGCLNRSTAAIASS